MTGLQSQRQVPPMYKVTPSSSESCRNLVARPTSHRMPPIPQNMNLRKGKFEALLSLEWIPNTKDDCEALVPRLSVICVVKSKYQEPRSSSWATKLEKLYEDVTKILCHGVGWVRWMYVNPWEECWVLTMAQESDLLGAQICADPILDPHICADPSDICVDPLIVFVLIRY